MHGTKIGFMRDLLSETKLCLKHNEVNHMEVPHYQEISVKNMYEDALKDELLVKYLPSKEQLSGRLPERDFFFWSALHTEAPVHEGHRRGGAQSALYGRRG